MDILYSNIKNRRCELGMSQADLAKKLGYSDKSTIARIEKGETDLGIDKVSAFARALETTPTKLMGLENYSPDFVIDDGEKSFIVELRRLPEERREDIRRMLRAYLALWSKNGR